MERSLTGAQAPDALARVRRSMETSHYQHDNAPLPLGLNRADALLGGGLTARPADLRWRWRRWPANAPVSAKPS
jgi:hypothetical protein